MIHGGVNSAQYIDVGDDIEEYRDRMEGQKEHRFEGVLAHKTIKPTSSSLVVSEARTTIRQS